VNRYDYLFFHTMKIIDSEDEIATTR